MRSSNAKEKLIFAARRLMLSKGYPGTTVDEICDAAGVTKGSFYHFFHTKEEIGLAALEDFHQRGYQRMADGPYNNMKNPVVRVFGFLDHTESISKDLWGDGCLLGNFAMDLAQTHPAIRQRVSELFQKSIRNLEKIFEPIADLIKEKNAPTARELAEHFIYILEGSIVLAKADNDWKKIPKTVQRFKRYLQRLIQ